jgi:hypothetical protein
VAAGLWFFGLEQLYLGDVRGFVIRTALSSPGWVFFEWGAHAVSRGLEPWTGEEAVLAILLLPAIAAVMLIPAAIAAYFWLVAGYKLVTGTAIDREGRPLLT